jgi:cation transport ATPase
VLILHSALAGAEQLKDAVEHAGYGAEIGPRSTDATLAILHRRKELAMLRDSFSTASMLLCVIFAVSSLAPASRMAKAWMSWLSVLSLGSLNVLLQIRSGRPIYHNAWSGAIRGRLNMDSMIALSSTVGFALSLMSIAIHGPRAETYFQTTAALITVVLGGRYLDSMSRKQAGESLVQLLSNRAERAMIGSGSRKVSLTMTGRAYTCC